MLVIQPYEFTTQQLTYPTSIIEENGYRLGIYSITIPGFCFSVEAQIMDLSGIYSTPLETIIVDSKYILLLNSDTLVWQNTLEDIYNFMENNPDVGACGCQVLLEDNTLDKACKRSFPNVKNSFFRLFHIPTKSKDDNYNLDDLDDNGVYEIDCLTGAFIFTRKKSLG